MAAITNNLNSASEVVLVQTDLSTGLHTFAYSTSQQTLHIHNGDGVPLTINILGTGVTNFACDGVEDKDVSGGYDVVVAAGDQVPINTFTRRGYLGSAGNNVDVTVTGVATSASTIWTTSS